MSEVIYLPTANDARRNSAVLAGDMDFTHDAPPQDAARLADQPQLRLNTAPENRVIYFGFDHWREELLHSSVKGRNALRDARVKPFFWPTMPSNCSARSWPATPHPPVA